MIYLLRVFKSYGGRSDAGQFSNTYHLRSDRPIEDAAWQPTVNTIVNQEKTLSLQNVSFMRALLTPFAENLLNKPEHVMRTFELQGTGGGALPAGVHGHDLNVCLIIKRQLATGRSGRLFLRGAVAENDTELGANGRYMLSPDSHLRSNAANDALFQLLALGADVHHCIPNPAGLIVQTSRDVTAFAMGGVTINRRDHRKGKQGGVINAAQKLIDAIAKAARKLAPTAAAGALLQGASGLAFGALRGQAAAFLATLSAAEVAELALPLILL
jgi:hypothetical protein